MTTASLPPLPDGVEVFAATAGDGPRRITVFLTGSAVREIEAIASARAGDYADHLTFANPADGEPREHWDAIRAWASNLFAKVRDRAGADGTSFADAFATITAAQGWR